MLRDRFRRGAPSAEDEKPHDPTPRIEEIVRNAAATPPASVAVLPTATSNAPSLSMTSAAIRSYQELKSHIHSRLIDRLDLAKIEKLHPDELLAAIAPVIRDVITEEGIALNRLETERVCREILDETLGLGPLEPLLADPTISDILVNGAHRVFIERGGVIETTDVVFKDDAHLLKIIDRVVTRVGRRIDESSPIVDARLKDGSRVNAIIPPLALDGPMMSIRKFKRDTLSVDDLIRFGTLTAEMGHFLQGCVKGKLNILISGGTGSGKTTLLNVMSRWIPRAERIVTIEDAAELQLQQDHVVRLETRIANIEGKGRITQRDLLINSLRMRPDRIIIGECRGEETLDMLQAMNTGHEGSMTTVHSNSARDALRRLETMVQLAGLNLTTKAMREQIASAFNIIVQQQRLPDGSRRIVEISEVTGMEGETVTLQPIFEFREEGIDAQGRFRGKLVATGMRPRFAERIERYGHPLPASLFKETV